jgi:hypothetical protein
MHGGGFLAIWSDLARGCDGLGALGDARALIRPVGVEGFVGCRIFRGLGTIVNRYFILYDLERPDVVGGPQYLARLNAPTAWSQRTMLRLRNFVRGGGRVVARSRSRIHDQLLVPQGGRIREMLSYSHSDPIGLLRWW